MIFSNKKGELRLYDGGAGASGPYYLQILFTQADLNFPLNRGKPEEILEMDRGNFDSNAQYREGSDNPIADPLPVRFSAKLDDTNFTHRLVSILGGVTTVPSGTTTSSGELTTTKAGSTLNVGGAAISTLAFTDTSKMAYDLEVKYDGSKDFIYQLNEIYFPPHEQTITEGEDGIIVEANGLWYGSGGTIASFTTGKSLATAAA